MFRRVLCIVAVSLCISALITGGMILSESPTELPGDGGLDFANTLAAGTGQARATTGVDMRDGYALQVRAYPSDAADAPLLILVHGSGWHGLQFDGLAQELSTVADVAVPDLRGHGAKPGRRGDVDYIGQFEDDLADLITASRQDGQNVVLAGHSSGGGLVVRFAGGAHRGLIGGAVLRAPYLQHTAPTMRENAGVWSRASITLISSMHLKPPQPYEGS